MLGREIRSKLDLLKEMPTKTGLNDYKHKSLKFRVGEIVMVKDYRPRRPQWILGKVKQLIGSTMCLVDVEIGTWRRHFNQLCKCSQSLDVSPNSDGELDMVSVMAALEDADESDYEDDLEFQEAVEELEDLPASDHNSKLADEEKPQETTTEQEEVQQAEEPQETTTEQVEVQQAEVSQETTTDQVVVQQSPVVRRSERGNKGVKPVRYGAE